MKKLLIGMAGILLILAIVLLVVVFNLGPVIKTAVNKYGPGITNTEMRLGAADVSVLKAQARLENFVLGNPEGFSSPNAFSVGSVLVDVDKTTLLKDTVIINRIEVLAPEITYEIKGTSDNFRTIMDNMQKTQKQETKGRTEESGKNDGRKVVIRDLILRDIQVQTSASIVGGEIGTATISEVHLKNIGEKQNGVDMAQAFMIVLNELYGQVISPDAFGGLKNRFKGYGQEVEDVQKEMKSLGDNLKGLFDK